jgi:hypothetical protein
MMPETQMVPSPYARNGSEIESRQTGAVAKVEQERAVAETIATLQIAKACPRDERQAMNDILNACGRVGLAKTAIYSYSRGGTKISGPSIRLAEAIAQHWGNMQFGVRELSQRDGKSEVESFAWDVQRNNRAVKVFSVPHQRFTGGRMQPLTDPRDIYELIANNAARRLRSCILAIVPGDVQEAAINQCEMTLRANIDMSPAAMSGLLDDFLAVGVTKAMIAARIQRNFEQVEPGQVVTLNNIYNSIRDGMSSPDEWFGREDNPPSTISTASRTETVKSKVQTKAAVDPQADDAKAKRQRCIDLCVKKGTEYFGSPQKAVEWLAATHSVEGFDEASDALLVQVKNELNAMLDERRATPDPEQSAPSITDNPWED